MFSLSCGVLWAKRATVIKVVNMPTFDNEPELIWNNRSYNQQCLWVHMSIPLFPCIIIVLYHEKNQLSLNQTDPFYISVAVPYNSGNTNCLALHGGRLGLHKTGLLTILFCGADLANGEQVLPNLVHYVDRPGLWRTGLSAIIFVTVHLVKNPCTKGYKICAPVHPCSDSQEHSSYPLCKHSSSLCNYRLTSSGSVNSHRDGRRAYSGHVKGAWVAGSRSCSSLITQARVTALYSSLHRKLRCLSQQHS